MIFGVRRILHGMRCTVYIFSFVALFCVPLFASAAEQSSFQLLEPLPGINQGTTNIGLIVQNVLRALIGIGALLAVVMLVVGGIQYMTSDSLGMKEAGRSRMLNAVWGLLLLISVVLILFVINPQLLNFDLANLGKVTAGTGIREAPLPPKDAIPGSGKDVPGGKYLCESPCTTIPPNIDVKQGAGREVTLSYAAALDALYSKLEGKMSWQVTEAGPPTVAHQDGCHYRGTCSDVAFIGNTAWTIDNIIAFQKAAGEAGLCAVYEPGKLQSCPQGVTGCIPNVGSGKHFSLYQEGYAGCRK